MSRADERRRAQARRDREDLADINERTNEPPTPVYDEDPMSWKSQCYGWRLGFHERARGSLLVDGKWRCRWCGRLLNPPAEKR